MNKKYLTDARNAIKTYKDNVTVALMTYKRNCEQGKTYYKDDAFRLLEKAEIRTASDKINAARNALKTEIQTGVIPGIMTDANVWRSMPMSDAFKSYIEPFNMYGIKMTREDIENAVSWNKGQNDGYMTFRALQAVAERSGIAIDSGYNQAYTRIVESLRAIADGDLYFSPADCMHEATALYNCDGFAIAGTELVFSNFESICNEIDKSGVKAVLFDGEAFNADNPEYNSDYAEKNAAAIAMQNNDANNIVNSYVVNTSGKTAFSAAQEVDAAMLANG